MVVNSIGLILSNPATPSEAVLKGSRQNIPYIRMEGKFSPR